MSLWSSIVGVFTGSGDTTEKIIDGISSGIDMAFYTDEEKAIASQKVLDFKLKYAQSTTAQNKARRTIAFIIVGLWAFFIVLAVALYLLNAIEQSKFIFEVLKDLILTPFSIVVGFYFLAHVTRTFNK